MTLVQSDGEIKFTFDGVARVIPAGVSEQSDNLVEFARRRGLKIRRITAGQAEVLAAGPEEVIPEVPDVVPLAEGQANAEPLGVVARIAAAVRKPKVSPSR